MAEGMTNKQIEQGIKKLINFGSVSQDNKDNEMTKHLQEGVSFVPLGLVGQKGEVELPGSKIQSESRAENESRNSHGPGITDKQHGTGKGITASQSEVSEKPQSGCQEEPCELEDVEYRGYKRPKGMPKKKKKKDKEPDTAKTPKKEKGSKQTKKAMKALLDENVSAAKSTEQETEKHMKDKAQIELQKLAQKQQKSKVVQNQPSKEDISKEKSQPNGNLEGTNTDKKNENIVNKELEKEKIFPLKKKSARFPRAKYFCRLCDYHMDAMEDVEKHTKDARHKSRNSASKMEKKLQSIPSPLMEHIEALDKVVEGIHAEHSLSESDMEYRLKFTSQLQAFFRSNEHLAEVRLCLFGSSLTSLGLKDSDININLVVPAPLNQAKLITIAFKLMQDTDMYDNVHSDFTSKIPCVHFTDPGKKIQCQLSISCETAVHTSQLLALYARCDPRVQKIGVTFRHWAKKCKVDKQDEGTLPAYCFSLMAVYYLQQCDPPVLPILLQRDKAECQSPVKNKKPVTVFDVDFEELQEKADSWQSSNTDSVGKLWLGLLRFYSLTFEHSTNIVSIKQRKLLPCAEKKWNTKKLAIEDPFFTKRNVTRTIKSFDMFDYIWSCIRKAYFYFGLPTNYSKLSAKQVKDLNTYSKSHGVMKHENHMPKEKKKNSSLNGSKEEEDQPSSDEHSDCEDGDDQDVHGDQNSKGGHHGDQDSKDDHHDHSDQDSKGDQGGDQDVRGDHHGDQDVRGDHHGDQDSRGGQDSDQDVQVDQDSKGDQDGDHSVNGDLAITGDTAGDQGVRSDVKCDQGTSVTFPNALTLDNSSEADKVVNSHEPVHSDPDRELSPDVLDCVNNLSSIKIGSDTCSSGTESVANDVSSADHISKGDQVIQTLASSIVNRAIEGAYSTLGYQQSATVSEENDKSLNNVKQSENVCVEDKQSAGPVSSDEPSESCCLPSLEYQYQFSQETLIHGKGPAVICVLCEKEGHLKNCCPEDKLPDLKPLPQMTDTHVQLLSSVLKKVPKDFEQCLEESRDRECIRRELEAYIRELYPDSHLHLFGSSRNGFGFSNSDLDLCVTFESRPTGEGIDLVNCIEEITAKLKKHRGLYNVFPIPTAKVPIVKFKHRRSQLEGDISMYNLLALHNTRMIEMYAYMDSRVRILGYALKVFAKICEIGDASRGSLSSYAYILILIYYLQQCKPPVLPVLQELYPGPNKPEIIVDGCNCWFYNDVQNLRNVWSGFGKNTQSVGKLWIGLFRFYTETFNLKDHVVCIRQSELLTRFEKLWNGKCIAIEDPFDLSHNLGGGLSHKMNLYIMKCFIHGRLLYCTPIKEVPSCFKDTADYFFDREQLTEGTPPTDRCCRVCSKIGHIAKECPIVQSRKNREERERRRKDEGRKNEDKGKNFDNDQRRKQDNYRTDSAQNNQNNSRAYLRSLSESSDQDYVSDGRPQPKFFNRNERSLSMPAGHQHDSTNMSPSSSPRNINRGPPHWQYQQHGGMSRSPQGHHSEYQQGRVNQALFPPGRPQTSPVKPVNPRSGGSMMFQPNPQQHHHPWLQQYQQQQQQFPQQQQHHHRQPYPYDGVASRNSQVDNRLSLVSSTPVSTNVMPCTLVMGNYYPLNVPTTQVPGSHQGAQLLHGVKLVYNQTPAPPQVHKAQGQNRQFNVGQTRGDNLHGYSLDVTVQNEFYKGGNSDINQGMSPKAGNRQNRNQRKNQNMFK